MHMIIFHIMVGTKHILEGEPCGSVMYVFQYCIETIDIVYR